MTQNNNTPKRKRCRRSARLAVAVRWIKEYNGKNLIKGYAKHFGVDKLCAIKELAMLGVEISEERKKQIIDAHNRVIEQRRKRKEGKAKEEAFFIDSDEYFSFIVGYTSGGTAYGIGRQQDWDDENLFDNKEWDDEYPLDEKFDNEYDDSENCNNSNPNDKIPEELPF